MQQCHEHFKAHLFGLINHPRDPISSIYPSKSVAALTTPVLKGALSKAQKDLLVFCQSAPKHTKCPTHRRTLNALLVSFLGIQW